MNIRTANETDIPMISTLVKSLAHFYLDDKTVSLPLWLVNTLTNESFSVRIKNVDYLNYILEDSTGIVGYIAVEKTGHLYHLFVVESSQGKGYSRLLWEHAKELCNTRSFSLRSSLHAVPIYEKFGFKKSAAIGTKDGISFQPMEYSE